VQVTTIARRADAALLDELVPQADVVIDCCDNYLTRQAVNAACVAHARPLVSGAAITFDAQVSVWDVRKPDAPCYACVFAPDAAVEEAHCATMGVFAPLVGIIGAVQAAEALKLLTGVGTSLAGRLQMLDGLAMQWTELQVSRDPDCPVCARHRPAANARA
jgi:molybdopterin/thiamine biosynthesis adenylyltransferase